jgi:electron transfer flavoprotein alpha subunit
MLNTQGVMVFCEMVDGQLAAVTLELLGVGGRLAGDLGQELSAVVIGNNIAGLATEAIAYGANKVYLVDDPSLKDYLTDTYLSAMDKVVKQANPQILLLGQTTIGRDLAPRLAFRLNTATTLDCIALSIDPESKRLLQTKPVYGGNAQSIQYCQTDPQVATIRMKAMAPAKRDVDRKGEAINIPANIDPGSIRVRVIERKVEPAAGIKLEDAQIIVAGGRGIGSAEGFKQLEDLARTLKGAVGASRPPCDNKWVSDNLQIGLTGKIVSPDVYIAVALSGSSQHLSGCSGSKVIIAINKDSEANIFKVAHYGVVADWKKALPAFTARVKQLMG